MWASVSIRWMHRRPRGLSFWIWEVFLKMCYLNGLQFDEHSQLAISLRAWAVNVVEQFWVHGGAVCANAVSNSSTHPWSPLMCSSHTDNSSRKEKLWFSSFGKKHCWDLAVFKANSVLQASLPGDYSFLHLPPTPNSFCPLSTWIAKCHEQGLFFSPSLSIMSPAAIYLLCKPCCGQVTSESALCCSLGKGQQLGCRGGVMSLMTSLP